MSRRRRLLFSVDRYGWTWAAVDPSKTTMKKQLVEHWARLQATELRVEIPGRRDLTV